MRKYNSKKRREKSKIKKYYFDSWNFIKDCRNYIYFTIALFVLFFAIGYFIELPDSVRQSLMEMIEELVKDIEGKSFIELIWFILLNNIKVAFLGILTGVILGIGSIILSIANGFVPGFVCSLTVRESGFSSLWKIFPHGIFELPAIFISFGLGLNLGTFIFHQEKMKTLKKYLMESTKVFLLVIIPLLILAAIIEGILIIAGV